MITVKPGEGVVYSRLAGARADWALCYTMPWEVKTSSTLI